MFIFGLFSTNVPYLVLMGLYLLGFGVYSTNSIREKLHSGNEEDNKTIVLSKNQPAQLNLNKTFYYHFKAEKKNLSIVNEKAERLCQFDSPHKKHVFPVKEAFISIKSSYSLFSRPPPSCFI